MKELKRFLSYMGKYRYAYWSIFILTLTASAAFEIIYSYMNKMLFNAVEYGNRELFYNGMLLCLVIMVLRCVFPYLRYFQIRVVRKLVFDIKMKMFDNMMGFDMRYYETHHSAEALKTLNWDANSLKDAYFSHVYWVVGKVVDGVTAIVAMLVYSPYLALVSIAFSIITVFISVNINRRIKKSDKIIQSRVTRLAQQLSDILSGFTLLKMYKGASLVVEHFNSENESVAKEEKKRFVKASISEMVAFLMGILANFGTIIAGAVFVARGRLDYGTVMAVVALQINVSSMVQRFGSSLATLNTSLVKASRVFDFLEMKDVYEEEMPNMIEDTHIQLHGGVVSADYELVIDKLSFSYGGGNNIINNFDMRVAKGEKVMLMGQSGCGKSTFLKLLMRFYEKSSGHIKIYGKDIEEYSLCELRDMITYVPQNSYLFEGTIAENIAWGYNGPGKDVDEVLRKDIIEAAKHAYADEFIRQLPQGYDTHITATGSNLSGGQRQRIAIARAFMKNSPILLLDEPSAALDVQSEKMINMAMKQLMRNRVVIMVTHRMTSFEEFDRIVEL